MSIQIEIRQGDITAADTEAIVNAANNHLWMGSGVAGAIKSKGGIEIETEAVAKGPIDVGEAVETGAGKLPFKYILHAAGMGQDLKTNESIVAKVTKNTLYLADKLDLKSVAFPAIGTGVGGFSLERCAEIMIDIALKTSKSLKSLTGIVFILFDSEGYTAFKNTFRRISD
jgi:O-acetyl-ADP-ribose deacetylase (regulator of RNase III)